MLTDVSQPFTQVDDVGGAVPAQVLGGVQIDEVANHCTFVLNCILSPICAVPGMVIEQLTPPHCWLLPQFAPLESHTCQMEFTEKPVPESNGGD